MVCFYGLHWHGVFGVIISYGLSLFGFWALLFIHSFSFLFILGDDVSTLASRLYSIFIWLGMVSNPWFAGLLVSSAVPLELLPGSWVVTSQYQHAHILVSVSVSCPHHDSNAMPRTVGVSVPPLPGSQLFPLSLQRIFRPCQKTLDFSYIRFSPMFSTS